MKLTKKAKDRLVVWILAILGIALAFYIYTEFIQPQTAIGVKAYDQFGRSASIASPDATHIQFTVTAKSTATATTDIKLTNIEGYTPFTDSFTDTATRSVVAGGSTWWDSDLIAVDNLNLGVHDISLTVRQELMYGGKLMVEEVNLSKSMYVYECDGKKCIREGTICECSSCDECNEIVQRMYDAECAEIRLTDDIDGCELYPRPFGAFNNKVFDCQGHSIKTFDLGNVPGNTIKNCIFSDEIKVDGSDRTRIVGCTGTYDGISIRSDYCSIINNTVTNPRVAGVLVGGNHNKINGNVVEGSTNIGFGVLSGSVNNTANSNRFCGNRAFDIDNDAGSDNTGSGNTCDTTQNWNDDGTTGCTYSC